MHPIENVLQSQNQKIQQVIENLDQHELQIMYTRVIRTDSGIVFEDFEYQVNSNNYFYPASTIKFPVAVLAMEKLNKDGISLHTSFKIEGDSTVASFDSEIKKLFAVSDNDAYNRLFELLGQDSINQSLEAKGLSPIRISHRVSTPNSDDIKTKSISILVDDSTTYSTLPISSQKLNHLVLDKIKKGVGHYANDTLINENFDFSLKNYYPVKTQHEVMKRVIFPEQYTSSQQFDLKSEHRDFLLSALSNLPKNVGYDSIEYYDGYVKFLMYGDTKDNIPDHMSIHNKVGYAFGTLTDCAYIHDEKNDLEMIITATILVNKNQIFNDDNYEYDEVGIPFLAELGRQLYQNELKRKNQKK